MPVHEEEKRRHIRQPQAREECGTVQQSAHNQRHGCPLRRTHAQQSVELGLDWFSGWCRLDVFSGALLGFRGLIPTVSLGVTCVLVGTYGGDDGRIWPTRCAVIDAGLDGRWSPHRVCTTPPVGARAAHSARAAASRPGSTADPGASPRARTMPPLVARPCGDASLARSAPGTRPFLPCPCPFCSLRQYRRPP